MNHLHCSCRSSFLSSFYLVGSTRTLLSLKVLLSFVSLSLKQLNTCSLLREHLLWGLHVAITLSDVTSYSFSLYSKNSNQQYNEKKSLPNQNSSRSPNTKKKKIFLIKKIPYAFSIVSMLQRFDTLPPQVTILSSQLLLSHGWSHDCAQWHFSLQVCFGPFEFLWLVQDFMFSCLLTAIFSNYYT